MCTPGFVGATNDAKVVDMAGRDTELDEAVKVLHEAFDLGSDEVEAVVYGGTGR